MQTILEHLNDQKERKLINNTGIPRMVKGYFYEMSCVIFECFRVLKPGAKLFIVNDNARYAGASVLVDLISSSIAEKLGFRVPVLMVLPQGKGNSSQQMGEQNMVGTNFASVFMCGRSRNGYIENLDCARKLRSMQATLATRLV